MFMWLEELKVGQITLPIRSSLSDALLFAGGTKTIKGDIRFIKFKNDATVEKRNISRVGGRMVYSILYSKKKI